MNIPKHKLTAALFMGLLAASFLTNSTRADNHPTSLDGFKQIKVAPGLAQADHFIDTIRPFLLNHPESLEGRASFDLSVRKKGNGFVVNVKKTGYLDDSVKGEQFRGFVIRNSKGRWELISMGVKYLCYRGKSSTGLCL